MGKQNMKIKFCNASSALLGGLLFLTFGGEAWALQINRTSDSIINIDAVRNVYC